MGLKTKIVTIVDVSEFDRLVTDTYGRPYSFQQQDGCKGRGVDSFTVPSSGYDYKNATIPEVVNHEDMGVSFKAWKARDPEQLLTSSSSTSSLRLWWARNFYPSLQVVVNDLHERGLIETGTYTIDIDW